MKRSRLLLPTVVVAALAGCLRDVTGDDMINTDPAAPAPQDEAVESMSQMLSVTATGYFDNTFPTGLGGPEDYFPRTAPQRTDINNRVLNASPRPTAVYVILDHEWRHPYVSTSVTGTGKRARFTDAAKNAGTEVVDEAKINGWYNSIKTLADGGVTVFLFVYDDNVDKYEVNGANNPPSATTVSTLEAANLTVLVNKFKTLANMVWVVVEEYEEEYTVARTKAIAAKIRSLDSAHPIGVHQHPYDHTNPGSQFAFEGDPNIDVYMMQIDVSSADAVYAQVTAARDDAANNYAVMMAEVWGNSNDDMALVTQPHPTGARTELRRRIWQAMMAGAAGYTVVGAMEDADYPPDYSDYERLPTNAMLADWGRANGILSTSAFSMIRSMTPTTSSTYCCGTGVKRVMKDSAATQFILYSQSCTSGSPALVAKGLTGSTSYSVMWKDTTDGTSVSQTKTTAAGATSLSLTIPAGMASDCVVRLKKL